MIRELRRVRAPSARAQGVDSLISGSQPASAPAKSRTKLPSGKRPKNPARQPSQSSLPTPQTDGFEAEIEDLDGNEVETSSVLSEDSVEPSQPPQGTKGKGVATVSDNPPSVDELRAVRATNQIVVDKCVVYTERWVWQIIEFEHWASATESILVDWRQERSIIDPRLAYRIVELSKPMGTVSCYSIKEPATFLINGDTVIQELEEEVFHLVQLGKRDVRLVVSWDFRTIEEPRYDPPRDDGDSQTGTQTPAGGVRKQAATREDATRR